MTQIQTPGGEPQPIPVKEAVQAVQAAIEVGQEPPGDLNWRDGDYKFGLMARAILPGALEYLLERLGRFYFPKEQYPDVLGATTDVREGDAMYPAIAAVVAWHRAQKESER